MAKPSLPAMLRDKAAVWARLPRPRRGSSAPVLGAKRSSLGTVAAPIGVGRAAGGFQLPEALEDRRLLSGITKVGGVLTLTGNATGTNNLKVEWTYDHVRLNVVDNKSIFTTKFSSTSSIVIVGGTGNDRIYVSPNLPIPVVINGRGGHDNIIAPVRAVINGKGSTTPTPTHTPSPTPTPTPAPTPTPTPTPSPTPTFHPAISVPGMLGSIVVPDAGWAAPGGGAGNVAGAPGVTTAYGQGADSSAPQPVIDVLTQTVFAGTSIQFNGSQSKLGAGDPLSSLYQWNFGDPSGKYNTLVGWNAAHVYNTPGQHNVTLSVTNQLGETTSTNVTVNVLDDNRRVIYVDANGGNDANSGSSPGDPVRSVARAARLMGAGNVRILLHAGETFNVTESTGFSVTHPNVYIGSYGSGDKPVLLLTNNAHAGVQSFHGGINLVVNGITFDSVKKPAGNLANHIVQTAIFPGGTNILVENSTFLNVDAAVSDEVGATGVMMQDNNAPDPTGIRGYLFYGTGRDDVIIGNSMANSTREHCLRTEGVNRILVAYNNLTNLNRSNVDKQDFSKGTVEIHQGTYAYVLGNTLADGDLRAGPRGQGTEPPSSQTDWVVFDGNRVNNTVVEILPGTHHFAIRNNIIQNNGAQAINISPSDAWGRTTSDIRIFDNTAINSSGAGQFLYLIPSINPGAIILGNNLFVAPNLTPGGGGASAVYVKQTTLIGFRSIFNNVWPDPTNGNKWSHGGINFVWPNYTNAAGYLTPSQWAAQPVVSDDHFIRTSLSGNLAATGAAASDGMAIAGVFTDFYGNLRPAGGGWSVGAVQA